MPITYDTACVLRDALLERKVLSEVHSLPSADLATRILREVGLPFAYVPICRSSRTRRNAAWEMHLVVAEGCGPTLHLNSDKDEPASKVYATTAMRPMTDYVGELFECDLSRLWWAAPSFFNEMTRALVPTRWSASCDGGRVGWGAQRRAAFSKAFDAYWSPNTEPLKPAKEIPPLKLRFADIPLNPLPPGQEAE